MKNARGFTLLELLTTLTVAAILVGVAIPNFKILIQNDRQAAQVNSLLTALTLARSEAIKRGGNTTASVCAGTTTACGGLWTNGWVVYYTPVPPAATAPVLLRVYPALSGNNTLKSSAGNAVTFQSNGMSTLAAAATFTLCDSRGGTAARAVNVSIAGRAESSITVGQDIDGTALTCP